MIRKPENILSSGNFTSADLGAPSQWGEHVLQHPRLGEVRGKVFLGSTLGLTGMECSFGSLAARGTSPFLHAHRQNEELYIVLSGQGEFQVDGQIFPLTAGSAVRVAPDGARALRNTGEAPLTFAVIQAKAGSLEQATAADGIIVDRPMTWEGGEPQPREGLV